MENLEDVLVSEIKDIYASEKLLAEEIPKIQDSAVHKKLQKHLSKYFEESEKHYAEIQKICTKMEINPGRTKCKPIEEIVNDCNIFVSKSSSEDITDTIIASYIRKILHYQIGVYETAYRYAKELKLKKVKKKLKKCRDEKVQSEEKLLKISKKKLITKANNS